MSSTITKNWNDLPNEIKMTIIENLNYDERKSLRACSLRDKHIVDSTPLKCLEMVAIVCDRGKWMVTIKKSSGFSKPEFFTLNVEEVQEKIEEDLKKVTNVDFLTIDLTHIPLSLKLFDFARKLKVKTLRMFAHNSPNCNYDTAKNHLEQIQPGYLEDLEFRFSIANDAIYDMEQVIRVKSFSTFEGCIREDQLLKLEASYIYLHDPSVIITASSMNKLLKKHTTSPKSTEIQIDFFVPAETFNPNELLNDLSLIDNTPNPRPTDEICNVFVKMLDPEYCLKIIGEIQLRTVDVYFLYNIKRIKVELGPEDLVTKLLLK